MPNALPSKPPTPGLVCSVYTKLNRGSEQFIETHVYFADYRRPDIPFQQLCAFVQAHAVTGDGQPFDLRAAAATASVPTLVLTGSQDFICGPYWANVAVASYSQAQLVVFPHSGHFAHLEQPAEFANTI